MYIQVESDRILEEGKIRKIKVMDIYEESHTYSIWKNQRGYLNCSYRIRNSSIFHN